MEAAALLKILGLVDTALVLWEAHGKDEADLFAVREAMAGMTDEQKMAFLMDRYDDLQARADELANRGNFTREVIDN